MSWFGNDVAIASGVLAFIECGIRTLDGAGKFLLFADRSQAEGDGEAHRFIVGNWHGGRAYGRQYALCRLLGFLSGIALQQPEKLLSR